jgi:hypothetical protein
MATISEFQGKVVMTVSGKAITLFVYNAENKLLFALRAVGDTITEIGTP